uniref:Uncharacterized protein n=1 Tax=Oryza brachyantha TaxID=4533 RepID=J3LLZ4_ORYBR
EEADAAFAENIGDFLPWILQSIVVKGIIKQKFNAPHFDILNYLGTTLLIRTMGRNFQVRRQGINVIVCIRLSEFSLPNHYLAAFPELTGLYELSGDFWLLNLQLV